MPQKFALMRGKIAYAANQTCPLQTCRLNLVSQIPASDACASDMKLLRSLLSELKPSANDGMKFQNLDLAATELRVYTDSNCANSKDCPRNWAGASMLWTPRAGAISYTGPAANVAASSNLLSRLSSSLSLAAMIMV